MARSESRTKVSIWGDDDFVALTKDAQRVYWMLKSQPTITLCGVLALTPGRWVNTAADETLEDLMAALVELDDADFVVIDYDTEEVWVRTFILHDGVARSPKTLVAAKLQVGMIASATIRKGVVSMFDRAANGGDAPGSAKPLENRVSDKTEIPYSDNPDTPRVRADAVSVSCLQSPSPSPSASDGGANDASGISQTSASRSARRQRDERFEDDFDILWESYPRKVDRKAALRNYIRTRKAGADPAELLKAVVNYELAVRGRAPNHIKHGATFFGPDEHWIGYVSGVPAGDSPLPPPGSPRGPFRAPTGRITRTRRDGAIADIAAYRAAGEDKLADELREQVDAGAFD